MAAGAHPGDIPAQPGPPGDLGRHGWEDCHLHVFQIGKTSYGPDPEGEPGYADETKARLADVARVRTRIGYEYDFGDGWEHEILVEARAVAEADKIYPACIAGEAPARRRTAAAPAASKTQRTPGRAAQRGTRRDAGVGG